jgi:phospholipase/carboxylesterase
MRLHPHIVHKAVLLRASEVLEEQPDADLSDASVLQLNGAADPFGDASGALAKALRDDGAHIDVRAIEGWHGLTDDDIRVTGEWLKQKL